MKLTDFLNLSNTALLGMDIGSHSIKIAELAGGHDKYSLKNCANVEITPRNTSVEHNEQDITNAIHKCIEHIGAKTLQVVNAVNGPSVTVRGFKFPSMSKEQIPSAVLQKAKETCPLDVRQCVIDYQLLDNINGGSDLAGLFVAARTDTVQQQSKRAADAGLQNTLIDVNSMAVLNCFCEFGARTDGQTDMILDIGCRFTNLIILPDRDLPFTRCITSGSEQIVRSVSEQLDMSAQTVQETLHKQISPQPDEDTFRNCLKNGFQTLINELTETLTYYRTHENQCELDKIHICGGFANAAYVEQLLNDELAQHVQVWNPLEQIPFDKNTPCIEEMIEQGPSMAVAVGLAMRSVRYDD